MLTRLFGGRTGDTAIITVDGMRYGAYPLDTPCEIEIKDENGQVTNVAVIENGEIYMKEATCRDHLCMKQGHLSNTNRSIVCLPNKVVISVDVWGPLEYDAVAE